MPNSSKTIRSARSLSAKGRKTRGMLLKAALNVFCQQGYFEASVSEITRSLGISQGAFYQYFSGKDQVLMELADKSLQEFWDASRDLSLDNITLDERLTRLVELLHHHSEKYFPFNRMLGELELIDPVTIAYFDSIARYLRTFMRAEATAGSIKPLNPNLFAYGLMGMVHFALPEWAPELERESKERSVRLTVDLLLNGISGAADWKSSPEMEEQPAQDTAAGSPLERQATQGGRTKRGIFEAAERTFGRLGYNRASIADITREAGVAQGTFYVHFSSKLNLLEGVIEYLGLSLRKALSQVTREAMDRRDAERGGMMAFYSFIRRHRELYRVVAECEAIAPKAAKLYYTRLGTGYRANLSRGMAEGQIREIPLDFLVRSLMGFNHMIGLKWLIWNSSPYAEVPAQMVEEAAEIIISGLQPS